MTFNEFQRRVLAAVGKTPVRFSNRDGKFVARLPGNILLVGNSRSTAIAGKWGADRLCHQAMTAI